MPIELPVIQPSLEIGTINPQTSKITVSDNHISYSCSFSTDCCGDDSFFVPVTDMDIERIEQHDYEIDQIVEILSPELRFAKDNTAEKNYWIKRKPFTGKCTFLKDSKCSIHQFKPFACRIFPFQLLGNEDGSYRVAIHKSKVCTSIKAVSREEAENRLILADLLKEVQLEDERRLVYFKKYGNG